MDLLARLGGWRRWPPAAAIAVAGTALGVVTLLDFVTGAELSFSVFYVLPIALVTVRCGRRRGLLTGALAAHLWLAVDRLVGPGYSHALVPIWNAGVRLAFFVTITLLLARHERLLAAEMEAARSDLLTGIANRRGFMEALERELAGARRRGGPLMVAMLDLDDFKAVNDRSGHSAGDELLQAVASGLADTVRKSDTAARLGGDEFAVVLPDTAPTAAAAFETRLRRALTHHGAPIRFSLGVVSCPNPPAGVDEVLGAVDDAMYTAKQAGKGRTHFATLEQPVGDAAAPAAPDDVAALLS